VNRAESKTFEMPKPVIIRERISRKMLRAVMANFRSVPDALLELVDNAFDEFDGYRGGTHLDVTIKMAKDSIIVENLGGKGMGRNELNDWLNWGEALKTDAIGVYGQGGKAAMGYLGSAWIVHTKRWDQPWLWEIKEDNWDDMSSSEKTFKALPTPINKGDQREGLGYCRFEIKNLKKRRQDINRLKTVLSNIYRKYLEEGKASITVNGESVAPLVLPIYEGFKIQQIAERTPQGCRIKCWIGRLKRDVRVRGGPRIIGGMRLLRKGRLICDGEYFGHPDFRHKASLGMLIGEVELTKVPVLPNKTGFDIDSPEWYEAQRIMYDILKPHIEALLKQREEETVTREEKKRVSQVRRTMIEAFKLLSKYGGLYGRFGEDTGRKRREQRPEDQEPIKEPVSTEEDKRKYKQQEPRTPPPEDAAGRLKRLGKMPEWELKVLEPEIRSEWGKKNGNRCLIINKKYCLYEERKGDDIYIAETAALQLARPEEDEKLALKEYLNEVDLLMRAFCEVYNSAL